MWSEIVVTGRYSHSRFHVRFCICYSRSVAIGSIRVGSIRVGINVSGVTPVGLPRLVSVEGSQSSAFPTSYRSSSCIFPSYYTDNRPYVRYSLSATAQSSRSFFISRAGSSSRRTRFFSPPQKTAWERG